MLTLIHGDDAVSSRKAFRDLLAKNPDCEKIFLDGIKLTFTDIISAADSLSLFAQKRLVCIENLLKRPSGSEKDKILDFFKTRGDISAEIIIWEEDEIGKAVISKYFSRAKVIFCPLPAVLFKFLDSIGEKPVTQVLSMFHELLATREAEFIFSMLVRQWRYLIIACDLKEAGLADLPAWQAHKFVRQASFFKLRELISAYRQLLSLDARVKMGLNCLPLSDLLDIFFVSLYYKI